MTHSALNAYHWSQEPLDGEAYHNEKDIIVEGSDAEDSLMIREERRRRREAIGRRYLLGYVPFIQTAALQGPFGHKYGWGNPWELSRTRPRPQWAPPTNGYENKPVESTVAVRREPARFAVIVHTNGYGKIEGDTFVEDNAGNYDADNEDDISYRILDKQCNATAQRGRANTVGSDGDLLQVSQEDLDILTKYNHSDVTLKGGRKREANTSWVKGGSIAKRSRHEMSNFSSPTPAARPGASMKSRQCPSRSGMPETALSRPLSYRSSGAEEVECGAPLSSPSKSSSYCHKVQMKSTDTAAQDCHDLGNGNPYDLHAETIEYNGEAANGLGNTLTRDPLSPDSTGSFQYQKLDQVFEPHEIPTSEIPTSEIQKSNNLRNADEGVVTAYSTPRVSNPNEGLPQVFTRTDTVGGEQLSTRPELPLKQQGHTAILGRSSELFNDPSRSSSLDPLSGDLMDNQQEATPILQNRSDDFVNVLDGEVSNGVINNRVISLQSGATLIRRPHEERQSEPPKSSADEAMKHIHSDPLGHLEPLGSEMTENCFLEDDLFTINQTEVYNTRISKSRSQELNFDQSQQAGLREETDPTSKNTPRVEDVGRADDRTTPSQSPWGKVVNPFRRRTLSEVESARSNVSEGKVESKLNKWTTSSDEEEKTWLLESNVSPLRSSRFKMRQNVMGHSSEWNDDASPSLKKFPSTQILIDAATANPWTSSFKKSRSRSSSKRVSFASDLVESTTPTSSIRIPQMLRSPPPPEGTRRLTHLDDHFHYKLTATAQLQVTDESLERFMNTPWDEIPPMRPRANLPRSSPPIDAMAEAFITADNDGLLAGGQSRANKTERAGPISEPREVTKGTMEARTKRPVDKQESKRNDKSPSPLDTSFSITPDGRVTAVNSEIIGHEEDELNSFIKDMSGFLEGWDVDVELKKAKGDRFEKPRAGKGRSKRKYLSGISNR